MEIDMTNAPDYFASEALEILSHASLRKPTDSDRRLYPRMGSNARCGWSDHPTYDCDLWVIVEGDTIEIHAGDGYQSFEISPATNGD